MPKIKIDTAGLHDLSIKTNSIKNQVNECRASVETAANRLDWQVSSKSSIEERLKRIQSKLQKQAELMGQYAEALNSVNDNFSVEDRKISQNAKNILYTMNSISVTPMSNGASHSNNIYKIDEELTKTMSINNLFGSGLSYTSLFALLDIIKREGNDALWDISKDSGSFLSGVTNISDLMGVFFEEDTVKKYLGWAGDLKSTEVFKAIGYGKDIEKLLGALQDGDQDKIFELGEKYIKKGAKSVGKNTFGVSGFTSAGYINLGWNFAENVLDIDQYASATSSNSDIVGLGKYIWHCTGGTLLETGAEMGYDIVKNVGGIFGFDLDKVYEDLTGVGGVEGFYKGLQQVGDELFGDYYNGTKSSGVFQGTVTLVGDSLGWWGEQIGNAANYIGDAVSNGISYAGEKISDGMNWLTDTVSGWFK